MSLKRRFFISEGGPQYLSQALIVLRSEGSVYRRDFFRSMALAAAGYRSRSTSVRLPLPDWAKTGKFTFMGLDGGPLAAEKGLRSGWEYFTRDDPKGVVKAVREFYRRENVIIPKTAGVNWIHVTWTNGWSKVREIREQWPLAARYMYECRRNGIHTSVYISAANMFWEDYFEHAPESRKWIDTGEAGFIRHYGGRMERVMANIKLPA